MGYEDELHLENDYLLWKEPFEGLMGAGVARKFEWLEKFPKVKLDGSESVSWAKESYKPEDDPMKRFPALHTPGGDFPRMGISKFGEGQAVIASWGFEFVIPERVRRYKTQVDMLARILKRSANWLGEWQNARIFGTLIGTDGIQKAVSAPTPDRFCGRTIVNWGVDGQNPINDMTLIRNIMEDVLSYTATDYYVSKLKFEQFAQWLNSVEVDKPTRDAMYGMAQAGAASIYIPLLGGTLHKVNYGLADGDILALDGSMSPMTIYYDYNPEYQAQETFTMENGQVIRNDFGLHSHQYKGDKHHELIKQIWLENVIAVKDTLAGYFCEAGTYGI